MHPIDHIKSFATLTPETESRLLDMMKEEHPRRGHTIQGPSLATFACYIKHGAARIFYTQRGREYTVNFAFDDQFLIVPPSMAERHGDTITIEFLEPSTIIVVPGAHVRDELQSSARISESDSLLFINSALIQHTRYLEDFLSVALTCNARDRYLWAIKMHPRLTSCATLTQIASYLGMTKETLYRLRASLDKNIENCKE